MLAEFFILRFEFIGKFLFVREIEFNQHELLGNIVLECIECENFVPEFDAEAAPVGAGEIDQYDFLFGFGLGFGGLEVGLPSAVLGANTTDQRAQAYQH